ncbi:NAD(P)/FAD-dependent oxidoreductase [Brevibacillus borstelensis]|uniref:NAD(P)/FAD-dependent oxidoreductase n=1 Tax=Brevibacillus borstelensis TaxID=45462 RepID=UPI0030BE5C4C
MDLRTGTFYWPTRISHPPSYPALDSDISCDVLIIGAGITGAQCGYYLRELGRDVVIVEKGRAGYGSTCTNTAVLQYAGDKMAHELVDSFGETNAIRHLKLCREAIDEIETAVGKISRDTEFVRRDSLYYASAMEDVAKLEKDFALLSRHGFSLELLTERQIRQRYPFSKHAALYIGRDAEINPYAFTLGLLETAHARGVRIYENTRVAGKQPEKDGTTLILTDRGKQIRARIVIVAAGCESLEFRREKNASVISSYAVISTPVDDLSIWANRTLIWETARPYVYMRTTKDNRVIIGGLDEKTASANKRDSMLLQKREQLISKFNELFPGLNIKPAYHLAGFYGGTHDGLPMIGMYEDYPGWYFLFSYGDSGIVYSMLLSKILRDVMASGSHPDLGLYLQERPAVRIQPVV